MLPRVWWLGGRIPSVLLGGSRTAGLEHNVLCQPSARAMSFCGLIIVDTTELASLLAVDLHVTSVYEPQRN